MTPDELPNTVVFDTEPLVAYFCDEPGGEEVEQYLEAVKGTTDGYVSAVNLAELGYVVRSLTSSDRAETVTGAVEQSGIKRVDTAETWETAATFKHRYSPALGDAFALATARAVGGTLLVGADDDYDTVTDVPVRQFRVDPA